MLTLPEQRKTNAFMPDAIVKVSWRISPFGDVVTSSEQAEGGICGTCFTLESGITISCAHNTGGIFIPNEGHDTCRVFVVEADGRITEINDGCLQLFPEYDACVITDYQSSVRYKLSKHQPHEITVCDLLGYKAHAAPFGCNAVGARINIIDPHIDSAAQTFLSVEPQLRMFDIDSDDVKIEGKQGYLMDVPATVGLSGGPMLDAADGSVAGLCFMGLPPDEHHKTQIGAIDVRQFPFLYK